MEDENIIALYWERCETAIRETQTKYGRLCRTIVGRVLSSREDTEECLDDVYVALWDSIPPQRPVSLPAYIGKTARNTALKRLEYYTAKKRSAAILSLEELGDCVSGGGNPDETAGIADAVIAGRADSAVSAEEAPAEEEFIEVAAAEEAPEATPAA